MINWAKRALTFIARLGSEEGYEEWTRTMHRSMLYLKSIAGADEVILIKKEDAVTARLILPDTMDRDTVYVDLDIFSPFQGHTAALYYQLPESSFDGSFLKLFNSAKSLVVLPVKQDSASGYILLSWTNTFVFDEDFTDFIEACLTKINEAGKLAQTYYALEELKVRFNAILQTVPQSIVFIDDSGKNSWINDQAAKLFGMSGGSVVPTRLSEAMQQLRVSASNKEEIFQRGIALFRSEDKTIKDWQWIFNEPEFLVLNVCCTPTVSENVSGMLWTFADCTQQYLYDENLKELNVQLEEKSKLADEQNRAKSEFLANMSHEIRTPMNGVIGMTSLLRNTTLTEDQFDFVESIRISADSLLEIINEILDFSKIESGKLELEEHPFFIHKIIEETYDLLALKALEKDLDLLYVIAPEVPLEIVGDMTRLRQIVVNLVGNAIKFTPSGEILTSIKLLSKIEDQYELEFSVKDSGIGIPEDKMHKLFSSFSQVDSSTTRKYGGTGLGLAISARLIEKMQGSINVESEVNVGTTFKFTIQVKVHTGIKEYKSVVVQKDLAGKSALIIDDNTTNLKILKEHCAQWGMLAITFDNGPDGIEAMAQRSFDIVIIDMLMPDMNGIDVAVEIRKRYGDQIPLVLFGSSFTFPAERKEELSLFAAILDKPIKPDYFHKMLLDRLSVKTSVQKKVESPVLASAGVPSTGFSTLSILVAEDNIINQKIMVNAFKNAGYACDVVSNGLEVLSSLKRQKYDVVMMDVQMPEMDGLQATREIIKEYGRERPVIIAMTAGAYEQDREECLAAGMDDYITKPIDFDNFYAKFNYWAASIGLKQT
ncbi:response regulator [Pedobacter sp. MC2016-14]|uniref:response regulator n=1 Tax=Pedobacter sp. MC2016-14 TaxID=2897327 RepID=UPI001E493429|nr:response regulator [Pedobacter sp. MC2016-14]MCD0486684.1 response regulator [Pedobacter sp. MC2016-14]